MRMLDEQTSNDVEVSLADQERINAFSRLNSRAADAEARIAQLRDEKETLGDLEMELELEGEDEVLYKIGDAFLKVPGEEALQLLARDTERVDAQLARLEAQKEQCDAGMQELKVKLYAKFGKENINLER
ncbi:putative GIM3-Gim complex component [Tilletiopsis washingtonensis]|uniref:Prefoldin subunit 4 n=1 Tax=Tilletiopsis washingtonensis TaxID=58919 RepID=A0A316ZCV2_9BASI|nr:putative GIM3-Gim complex component [Tilletiopsis washingtonensis]PWN98115.1 putative GIM3-Gim complex component [Tilletiopsis washingtonensis]